MSLKKRLETIQGRCKKCNKIIDSTRIISDKPTAKIFCEKCWKI